MNTNSESLVGLSVAELEALADTLLAPAAQHRLDFMRVRDPLLSVGQGASQPRRDYSYAN